MSLPEQCPIPADHKHVQGLLRVMREEGRDGQQLLVLGPSSLLHHTCALPSPILYIPAWLSRAPGNKCCACDESEVGRSWIYYE